jgi:Domain of unknown function (DUF222)
VGVPAPVDTAEAVDMVLTGLKYLAAVDPSALSARAQAECLQAFEQADAIAAAARARILAAFTAGHGYSEDADYSPTSWLIHRTRITKGAARGHLGWARRAAAHPQILTALAEGTVLTESMARAICGWTDKLPASCRDAADGILVAAARAGARKDDLAALAAEIYARSLPDDHDDPEPDFEDRKLRVETTFAGAGVMAGDLTPRCAAVVTAVLDALSAPRGAEDTRTKEQRYHDALEDAMRRLVASDLLPERAGQPVKVWAHVTLAELRALDDGSVLAQEWIGEMAVRWAANRAAASQTGSDGAAWLDGKPARAMSCDATIIPVVTGQVDPGALDELMALCLQFTGHDSHCADPDRVADPPDGDDSRRVGPRLPTAQAQEMLRHAIIRKAVDLVSGPGGLASFLRTRLLGARLAGPSLPLDVGHSAEIPAAVRRAVVLRDQHCRWAGGCDQPASACEVHHVTHLADGGTTSVDGCALYCFFHHHVAIHQWGWTVALHPDGTTTARSPDGTKVLHSHGCATRRSVVSPAQRAGTRGDVSGSDGLPGIRKVTGTVACQKTGGRAQASGAVRRGIRAIWRKLDCLKPSLQKVKCATCRKDAWNRYRSLRRGVCGPAVILWGAGAMPCPGIEGDVRDA